MCTFAVMGDDLEEPELFQAGNSSMILKTVKFRESVPEKSWCRAAKQVLDGILVSSPTTNPATLSQKWTRTSKTAFRIEARRSRKSLATSSRTRTNLPALNYLKSRNQFCFFRLSAKDRGLSLFTSNAQK